MIASVVMTPKACSGSGQTIELLPQRGAPVTRFAIGSVHAGLIDACDLGEEAAAWWNAGPAEHLECHESEDRSERQGVEQIARWIRRSVISGGDGYQRARGR